MPVAVVAWVIWLFLAGRGAGKSRSGAEAVSDWCRRHPGMGVALVGETLKDVRRTMCEGPSGLRAVLPPAALRGGSWDRAFNRTEVTLHLANGCWLQGYSSEVPESLRGPEHGFAWVDEPAKLRDAARGVSTDPAVSTTWNNLMLGLRAGPHPQVVVTGTPKRIRLVKDLLARGEPAVRVTRGSTWDNAANLAPSYLAEVIDPYRGTRLERQELGGELIDEVEGALVRGAVLETTRVDAAPPLLALAVGVDPPGGRVECGIVAVGRGHDEHGYVIADASKKMGADEWPLAAVRLADQLGADWIVGERNYGGDMVETLVRQAARALHAAGERPSPYVSYRDAHAARGKAVRAQPVGLLFDQRRFHLAGNYPDLEDELTTWTEQDPESPNRLDALVWAAHAAVLGSSGPGEPHGADIAAARVPTAGQVPVAAGAGPGALAAPGAGSLVAAARVGGPGR